MRSDGRVRRTTNAERGCRRAGYSIELPFGAGSEQKLLVLDSGASDAREAPTNGGWACGGNEPGNCSAVPGDLDLVTPGHIVEQRKDLCLGLSGRNLPGHMTILTILTILLSMSTAGYSKSLGSSNEPWLGADR